jgi:preprotein translocase subunit SecE
MKGWKHVTDNHIDEAEEGLVEKAKQDRAAKKSWFGRMMLFFRQVIIELKKVVTPTRRELLNFTAVVLVFVVIMMAIIWSLDQFFGFVVLFVFGNGIT